PDDPIYRLVFPQADMLPSDDVARIADLLKAGASRKELNETANKVRAKLNPHPRRSDGPQRAQAGQRGTHSGYSAQVPRDGALLSEAGADVSCVLHLLLPLGAVRRRC